MLQWGRASRLCISSIGILCHLETGRSARSSLEFEKAPSGTGRVTFLRALFKSDLFWFLVQALLLGGVGSTTLLLSDVFGVLAEARIRGAMVTQH